jgi:hypothetical protein
MPKRLPQCSAVRRSIAAVLCLLFIVFLIGIQPHRVHHLFDGLSDIHSVARLITGDGDEDHESTFPPQSRCAIYSAAQTSHIGQNQLTGLAVPATNIGTSIATTAQPLQYLSFSAFHRRAPPRAALVL